MKNSIGTKNILKVEEQTVYWVCVECGTTGQARLNNWNSPRSRTCCGNEFYKNRDRLLIVWTDIKSRTSDKRHPAYERYKKFDVLGWDNFQHFKEWALSSGYKYGLDIDRVDGDKGYCPENCRFVSRSQNNRNRKSNRLITAFGETKTLVEWEEDFRSSVQAQSIAARLDRYGWDDVEWAITAPPKSKKQHR